MANSNSWKQHFEQIAGDDEGDKNAKNFSKYCTEIDENDASKLRDLTEDSNTLFVGSSNGKIILLHNPKNFGGTRTRKANKIACLTGMGPEATGILLDEESILFSNKFKGANKEEIMKCSTSKELENLKKQHKLNWDLYFFQLQLLE